MHFVEGKSPFPCEKKIITAGTTYDQQVQIIWNTEEFNFLLSPTALITPKERRNKIKKFNALIDD